MKILITGVCGFVGSALAECLLERVEGVRVAGIDNLMRSGVETNRMRIERLGVEFIHGDLRSASDIANLPACDWVIEAAANPSVLAGLSGAGSSRRLFEHNLAALGNVLEYCREQKAGLLLLSSSRVYSIPALAAIPLRVHDQAFAVDPAAPLPVGLTMDGIGVDFSTAAPLSLYGATKLASEIIALEYGAAFHFPVWITRCGVLTGAGQFGTPAQGIFAFWVNAHLRRRSIHYIGFNGTGYQTRDAFHPRDLAALLVTQMRTARSDGQRVYTAGGGPSNAMSLAQLTAWCDERFGCHSPAVDPEPRMYDIPWVAMDNTRAAKDFGWQIEISLPTILEGIAQHAYNHPDWLEVSHV
ncbi:MAG: CDP-tyvelose epimerase [Acidobacteria bacterium]|nr:MAG: CDP-tyvelose epimerase [Acidobacteriota bacterium]